MSKSTPLTTRCLFATIVGMAAVLPLAFALGQNLASLNDGASTSIMMAELDCDPVNDPSSCAGL